MLVVDALVFTLLVAITFTPLERVLALRKQKRTAFATDIAFATLGQIATRFALFTLVGTALAMLDPVAPTRPLESPVLQVALGLVVFETMGYAYHRLAHAVPWLFRVHEVHHASETLDWLASFRQHPIEIVLMTLAQNVPLVLLGIPLGSHALVVILLRVHTVFVHSNVRVPEGPWSLLVATPRFHHRHHDRQGTPANFATLSPLLDRLFGTYDAAPAGALGLDTPMPSTFAGLLLHPLRSVRAREHDAAANQVPLGDQT